MIFNHCFTFLCCLIGVLVSTEAQSPTENPECNGMNKAKTRLEKGIGKFTGEPINCLVNTACTGLSCNGTHKSEPFYMSLKLQHCMKPDPEIHIDLIYPKRKLNVHRELKQDSTVDLYSTNTLEVKLKLNLKRKQNRITTSIDLEGCTKLMGRCNKMQTLLPTTTYCVNMNTCPKGQFNTTGYIPCQVPSTPTYQSPKTRLPTPTGPPKSSNPSTIHGVSTTKKSMSDLHSTPSESTKSTNPSTIHKVPTTKKSMPDLHSTPSEPIGAKGHSKKGDGHHHISVGEAVGIGFAVLAAILIVIGVVIYWKKFHHRSRLRAAYYNDISMNDPLYEDFGPEVA